MKIVKRHAYKLKPDELKIEGLKNEQAAKDLVKLFNMFKSEIDKNWFYQLVSDEYKLK